MPTLDTERKFLSEVLADIVSYGDSNKLDIHFESIEVGGTADIQPMGIPVVWVSGSSRFEVYTAETQITAAKTAGNSPLSNGAVCAIVVGDKLSLGRNKVDLTADTTYVTALVKGERSVIEAGVDFGNISAANITAFKDEMAAVDISFIDSVTTVSPTHLNA